MTGEYLRTENWPEAIDDADLDDHAPAPWGDKTHDDPHDVDNYPSSHADAASIGEGYLGDVCPYCGVPLNWIDDEVVTIDGERGLFADVNDLTNPVPAYHPECWNEREAAIHGHENADLRRFQ